MQGNLRRLSLGIIGIVLFALPLIFCLQSSQVFALPKFLFFLMMTLVVVSLNAHRFIYFKKLNASERIIWIFLFLFLVVALISTVLGLSPARSFWGSGIRHTGWIFWLFLSLFALTIRLMDLTDQEKNRWVLWPIIAAGIIQSIIAIIQWWSPHFLFPTLATDEFLGRAFGTLGHPSFLGQFMVFPIFAALGQKPRSQDPVTKEASYLPRTKSQHILVSFFLRFPWPLGFVYLVLLTGLYLSFNRASFLGVFFGLIFLIFLHVRERRKNIRTLTLPFILSLIFIVTAGIAAITLVPSTPAHQQGGLRSIQVRSALWRQVPAIVSQHPLFGTGFETIDAAFSPTLPSELLQLEKITTFPDSSHNFTFDLLIQTGLLGTLAFLSFLVSLFVSVLRQPKLTSTQKSLLAGLFAILVSWQFGFPGIVDGVMAIVMVGLVAGRKTVV